MTDYVTLAGKAVDELRGAVVGVDPNAMTEAVTEISRARRIAAYGAGREGLMMRALAMRLYHLGLDAHVVGDMSTPPLGEGDLLLLSGGPGGSSTVMALAGVARDAGARILGFTAQPTGELARFADRVLVIPAQTMADDQVAGASVLPMGSLYEGAQFLVFELLVCELRDAIGETPETMRARHTNLE